MGMTDTVTRYNLNIKFYYIYNKLNKNLQILIDLNIF